MKWVRLESQAYWIAFVASFLAVAVWESVRPLRPLATSAGRRWGNHGILLIASFITAGLVLRVSPVFLAFAMQDSRWGLLNRAWLPQGVRFAAAILAFDLLDYLTHRLFHSVFVLWRVHAVHHSDPDFDVSTAARFHPFEVLLSEMCYLGAVALLAPPPAAMLVSKILIVAQNFFAHANQSLPPGLERLLRWIVITPDLHRIHHSEEMAEQNLNFGQLFSWWDRLFGTYAPVPRAGVENLAIGLKELRGADTLAVTYLLSEPFHRSPDPA
jgi:sterol desaturase/sphingolipid hydroxylase (fatty acid hydroxylase superfamily)